MAKNATAQANVANHGEVTFVLPGDGRSGGVRVTVLMANLLLKRFHRVRIVIPRGRVSLRARLSNLVASLRPGRSKTSGFLHQFTGNVESYTSLDDLTYAQNEIVIAVGTYSMPDVRKMTKPVIKLRFNHGFPAQPTAEQARAWDGPLPTITVSNTLVPRLQELTGGHVLGVVPNGIDTQDYFPDTSVVRDGIGALYNGHPNKAPEDMIAVLQAAHQRWPDVPQYVFSTERKPAALAHVNFTRLPSVPDARAIYSRCKIWLLTSRTEGLPGVVLEAMACGCVVISTDNDGSLEILRHNQNGVIVRRGDRTAFHQEVGRLLGDPDLVASLSAAAVRTAEQFTWSRAADKMEQVLRDLRDALRLAIRA